MRNNPKQARSSQTVDFISEAAIQLLDTDRAPDFTTNHIAKRAGVSIGTLYRYFPDKGALLRFVVRREVLRFQRKVLETIDASTATDADTLLAEVVALWVQQFEGRRRVQKHLRAMIELDDDLMAEIQGIRLDILRRLRDKAVALEPSLTKPLSDAALVAALEAFTAALQALEAKGDGRFADTRTRVVLATSLRAVFLKLVS